MRKTGLIMACVCFFATSAASAGDREGRFALKGAGAGSCADYIRVARNEDPQLRQYVGWANGYFSRLNQTDVDTFDILPWQSSQLLYLLLADYCSKNPGTNFGAAVYALSKTLRAQRLTEKSAMSEYSAEDTKVTLYREVMRRVQQRLNAVSQVGLAVNGDLDAETIEALKKFQAISGLEPNGVPEEPTLLQLFYPADSPD